MKIYVKIPKPICRTPIPAPQKHTIDVRYTRKVKHKEKIDVRTYG